MAEPAPSLHLVPHTHWDREWYLPFEGFRERLVEMMAAGGIRPRTLFGRVGERTLTLGPARIETVRIRRKPEVANLPKNE